MHITEAITTAARMGWRARLVGAVLLIGPLPLTGDLERSSHSTRRASSWEASCSASSSDRPHDPPPQQGGHDDDRNH